MEKPDMSSPNSMLSWWLMASYAYYDLHNPIMLDEEFDELTRFLKDRWDEVDHPHKGLVTESHLSATTGYDIHYPTIVKHCVFSVLRSV